jgi:phosphate-selective porin
MHRLVRSLFLLICLGVPVARAQDGVTAPAAAPVGAEHKNAGYQGGSFFLRSDDDNFILIPTGRFQMDAFGYNGSGIQKSPISTFNPKRARIEVGGTIMRHWDFWLGSEFTGAAAVATDVYVIANYTRYANIQIGQFDAPFTMENRTSDKWMDLQERSVVVRGFGIPENKEIGAMLFGQPERKWAYWSLGLFNGEGQNVAPHRSNSYDIMGRAWFAPLGLAGMEAFKNIWIGGSFWSGWRSSPAATQVDRLAVKDQGGFTFFNPVGGASHFGDYGQVTKYAIELNVPVGPVVVKAEYVNGSEGTREISSVANSPANPKVFGSVMSEGKLAGDGFYVRASYFLWGDPLINGLAGMQPLPHLYEEAKPNKTESALQLVAEWDHLFFNYAVPLESGTSKFAGSYGVNTVTLGANYWLTKHVRLTGNFLYNTFLGNAATPLTNSQNSYEFTVRVAVAL